MTKVNFFSKGKSEDRNEDFFSYNENSFVLSDGATDKSGKTYEGKTGGEIISQFVVKEALSSKLNGVELINFLNQRVSSLYSDLNITDIIGNAQFRFSCTIVVLRIVDDKLIITCVGDSGFRINGKEVYRDTKQVDIINAKERSKYILETNDISGSREYIMPLLLEQFEYQNNPNNSLGYGVIDGTNTPEKFIKVFQYSKDKIKTIEIFSDGYFLIPFESSISEWEKSFEYVEREDPYKFNQYKSTKAKDDRTVAIIRFDE